VRVAREVKPHQRAPERRQQRRRDKAIPIHGERAQGTAQ